MRLRPAALLTLLLATAAGAQPSLRHVVVGGRDRTYLVDVPPRPAGQTLPLVVVFHGGGGNADQVRLQTGMSAIGAREGFITVYPNGSARFGPLLTWNTGSCCGYARKAGIDEAAFVRAMLDSLEATLPVDRTRVFATGMSNGGMMSYFVACRLADRFAAVAPVAGELSIPSCTPSRPVSVLAIHGTADEHLPYEGGTGPRALDPHPARSVAFAMDTWRTADRCTGAPVVTTTGRVTHAASARCASGSAVELFTIEGGTHAWPGGTRTRARADAPGDGLDASEEAWRFFAAHPRR